MQKLSKHVAATPYVGVMAKTAAIFGPESGQKALQFGKTLVEFGSVAVPLATLAASGIAAAASKLTEASRKATAYKSMMQENPHLHDRDAIVVQRYFNTLYRLNPDLANDPTVAASFVNNMAAMNNPMMPHQSIWGEARQLAGMKRPEKGPGFGDQLSDTLSRMGESIKKDRTEQLKGQLGDQAKGFASQQDSLRDQQRRNEILKRYATSMKNRAQKAGTYDYATTPSTPTP